MTGTKCRKTEDLSFDRKLDSLDLIPPGWQRVARETPVTRPKTKLTLKLDAEMVDWLRCPGRGWQPLMNAVLRAYNCMNGGVDWLAVRS